MRLTRRLRTRRISAAAAALLLVACFDPDLPRDSLKCSAQGNCPPALRCERATDTCVPADQPPVAGLRFRPLPATAEAGVPLTGVSVELIDAAGQRVKVQDGSFTLALIAGTSEVHLDGTLSAPAVDGVIVYPGLTFDRPGHRLALEVQGGGFGATSARFDVTPTRPVLSALSGPASLEGCAAVAYQLTQAQGRPVDLLVEVDPDGPAGAQPFRRATQGASAPGQTGVDGAPSSVSGRSGSYTWNTSADLPGVDTDATLRMTPSVASAAGEPVTISLRVENGVRFDGSAVAVPGIEALELADLDRDGWPDVVAQGSSVRIFYGRDSATATLEGAGTLRGIAVGDFNGDALLDVAAARPGGIEVAFQQRAPRRGFAPFAAIGVTLAAQQLVSADFDRDGRDDLAAVEAASGAVVVLAQQPGGGFVEVARPWTGTATARIAVGDLGRDGFPDLVIGRSAGPVAVARRVSFGFVPATTLAGVTGARVAVADLDHDGQDDVVALDDDGLHVASGSPATPPVTHFPAITGSALVLADVDGDGRTDVTTADGTQVVLHAHDADRSRFAFLPGRTLRASKASALAATDHDRDGRMDLVAVERGRGDAPALAFLTNRTPRRCGAGLSGARTGAGVPIRQLATADLNADGKRDVIVPHYQGLAVSYGLGDGSLAPVGPMLAPGTDVSTLAVADFDADGAEDIAFLVEGETFVTILFNDPAAPGVAERMETVVLPTAMQPLILHAADLDDDGLVDLAMLGSGLLQVRYKDRAVRRGFGEARTLAGVESDPAFCQAGGRCLLATADLDGVDGPELIAATQTRLRAFTRDATRSSGFGDPVVLEVVAGDVLAVGDLLGDARAEIVRHDLESRHLAIYRLESGTMAPVWSASERPSEYANEAVIGDLDGDGSNELVVTLNLRGTYVLEPRSLPTGAPVPLDRWLFVSGPLGLGHMDGDGRLDLLVGDSGGCRVARSAAGSFDLGLALGTIGAGSGRVALGDHSGDGLADLAALDEDGTGVRLARQSRERPGELEAAELAVPGSAFVGLADLDGNRLADVVSLGAAGSLAFLTGADASFEPICTGLADLAPLAFGDLDRDGQLDMVASGAEDVRVFDAPASTCSPPRTLFELFRPDGFAVPVATFTVDLDADGWLDVVSVSDAIKVALQSAGAPGTFEPVVDFGFIPVSATNPKPYRHGAVADVDRDGFPDVVVLTAASGVKLWRGDPEHPGRLRPGITIPTTGVLDSLALGDVDGDGWLDLLLTTDSTSWVYQQDPAAPGSFVFAYGTLGSDDDHGRAELIDFDADGRVDYLVTRPRAGALLVRGR